jgi:hypothetical protein
MVNINLPNDYKTATHSTSLSGSSYSSGAPLSNINIDPFLARVIEAQQQKIKNLQEQLAEYNQAKYKTLPANASRGKNVIPTSKKVSMTATDQINQQTVDRIYVKPFGHQTRCRQKNGASGGRKKIVFVK